MTGTTHYLGGVLTGLALVACATPDLSSLEGIVISVAAIGVSSLGSLIPDIDHPNSTASKRFKLLNLLYKGVSSIGRIFKSDTFEHRGIMHTLIVPVVFLTAQFFVKNAVVDYLLIAGMVGYLSHIVLDALNPTGIPVLAPFYKNKIQFLPKRVCIKTSSPAEIIVKMSLIVGIVFAAKPVISILASGVSTNVQSIAEKFV